MTNPDNVGGLPELPEPVLDVRTHQWADAKPVIRNEHPAEPYYTADQLRAYGELCRAAPAGGDDYKAIEAALHDAKMTIETLRAGYARIAEAAGCVDDCGKASAIVLTINALRDESNRKDSAPAGSVEVEKLIDDLIDHAFNDGNEGVEFRSEQVNNARAALLRKLQQGVE